MKNHLYIVAFLLFPCCCIAQQYYLKGQVKDDAGNALQNVSVIVASTGYRYTTGTEGSFGILTNRLLDTLAFVYDGYQNEKLAVKANEFVDIRLKRKVVSSISSINKLSSQTQHLKRDVQQSWFAGEETYASLVENNFVPADQYSVTSFTLNVDRASYSNIRRFLNTNSRVPPDAVRIEEMLNYFNFNYTEPPNSKRFSIHSTLTSCPWNKNNQLLFVQVNARKIPLGNLPATHMVFLIDVSGSMDMPNRLPLLKAGFKLLVNNLREQDSVSMVIYGGSVALLLESVGGNEKEKILKTIDSIQPGGSTPGESGIKLAYNLAKNHFIHGGNNRVVLATDGDFNVGLRTEDELEKLITEQKEKGIYLTCLGVGMGNYKDSKIQMLSKKGNGNFAYIDSYYEAEKVLLQEFMQTIYTVADNAFMSVKFDPAEVREYRLIGFDNKYKAVLDTASVIEGGEIGSGYSNLIAFEITPGKKNINSLDIRFSLNYREPLNEVPSITQEDHHVVMTEFNSLPASYRFASSVIMFGGLLRKSKFIKPSWNLVADVAKSTADTDNYSQREFLQMIEQAKKVYTKKRRDN